MSVSKSHELKSLTTILEKERGSLSVIESQISSLIEDANAVSKRIKNLKSQISKMENNSGLVITEHALLRFVERVHKIDLKKIEGIILSDKIKSAWLSLGNCSIEQDGYKVVIRDNKVVTICEK